jgi:hypothetical protein
MTIISELLSKDKVSRIRLARTKKKLMKRRYSYVADGTCVEIKKGNYTPFF